MRNNRFGVREARVLEDHMKELDQQGDEVGLILLGFRVQNSTLQLVYVRDILDFQSLRKWPLNYTTVRSV